MRKSIGCLLLAAALPGLARAQELQALQKQLFERYVAGMRQRATQDYRNNIYPTEQAIFFLAGWMLTGSEDCLAAARRQLAIGESWLNDDGVFDTSKSGRSQTVTRDATARQIYNTYVAYRVLGDRKLLAAADRSAEGMARHLVQLTFEWGGEHYKLFVASYETRAPYKPLAMPTIDVNQNAEIGLAFTMLYHDKNSRYYHSPVARDIALTELRASMALQKMDTGEIPLVNVPGRINEYDTGYGAYALLSWSWANGYWKDAEMSRHIARAVDWLDPFFDGETRAVHWYPRHVEGKMYPEAAWCVFRAFADQGKDVSRLLRVYREGIAGEDGTGRARWLCCQPYLYVMGVRPELLSMAGLPEKWARKR